MVWNRVHDDQKTCSPSPEYAKSLDVLNACAECESDIPEYRYYCFYVKANNYMWSHDFPLVARTYFELANDSILLKVLNSEQLNSIRQKALLFTKTQYCG